MEMGVKDGKTEAKDEKKETESRRREKTRKRERRKSRMDVDTLLWQQAKNYISDIEWRLKYLIEILDRKIANQSNIGNRIRPKDIHLK